MDIKQYVKTLDLNFLKDMDRDLMFNDGELDLKSILRKLNTEKFHTKTAYYYLALLSPTYSEELLSPEVEAILLQGKGDLFCDYLLFKNAYGRQKLLIVPSKIYETIQPMKEALEYLSKKSICEAQYLYADLLLLDIPGTQNIMEAYRLLFNLAKAGHRTALYRFSYLTYMNYQSHENYLKYIPQFLEKSYKEGYHPAILLLYQVYLTGLNNKIKPNLEKAAVIEDTLALSDGDIALQVAERFFNKGDNESLSKAVKYFEMASGLGTTIPSTDYAFALRGKYLLQKEKKEDYKEALDKAVVELEKLAAKGDVEPLTILYNIYSTEKLYLNKEKAYSCLDKAFALTNDSNMAYELFNMTKALEPSIERDEKLKVYASCAYDKYKKQDFDIVRYYYYSIKTSKDKYKTALSFLKKYKKTNPLFVYSERSVIYLALHKNKNALRNIEKAKEYENDVPKASALEYGAIYDNIGTTKEDFLKAADYYSIAAKEGNVDAAYTLARYYEIGDKIPKDFNKAKEYYVLASSMGKTEADYHLAVLSFKEKDVHKGLEWLQSGALLNNINCLLALGDLYFYGSYVELDYHQAYGFYYDAAKLESPKGYYMCGKILYEGLGHMEDKENGKKLMAKAVSLGFEGFEGEAGKIMLESGDLNGLNYLKKAASNGDGKAANLLGDYYENSKNGNKSDAEKYYLLGASSSEGNSLYHLGLIEEEKKHLKKAFSYFEKAHALDVKEAGSKAGEMAFKLHDYVTANNYLLNSLDDDYPKSYYYLALINLKHLVKQSSTEDGKYYAEKARDLGYEPAKRLLG